MYLLRGRPAAWQPVSGGTPSGWGTCGDMHQAGGGAARSAAAFPAALPHSLWAQGSRQHAAASPALSRRLCSRV